MLQSVHMVILASMNQDIIPLSHVFTEAALAFVIAMGFTPIYTDIAFRYQWWKKVRQAAVTGESAPVFHKLHAAKHSRNIPTMAGIVMIVSIVIVTLFLNLDRNQTWLPLATLVGFGALGLADDISNIFFYNRRGGLSPKQQLLALIGLAGVCAWWFFFKLGYSQIHVPSVGDFELGWLYVPLIIAVVVSTSKAVSITDGLDGLAGGLLTTAFGAYSVIAYFQGNFMIAAFCATVVGAMLAYTWFNIYPARFFMGQTGSTALGATLGVVAVLTNSIFVLPIIGGVFVLEAGSSLLQIASKKILKRKIFLSAPMHHHLEAIGWPETKVTMRLWIVGNFLGAIGLVLGLLGNKVL